jgi:lysophospholipase
VDRFEDYLDDLHQVTGFRDSLVDRFDLRLNSFLLGHSLGGVIVTRYLQEQGKNAGYSGFILSSPGFVSAVPIPNYKRVLAVGLTFIYPTLRLATGISANALMTDEAERLAYTTDPKVTSKVSLRWFTEFEQSGRIALDRAGEIALPHYVLYGSDDRVVCTAAIERFFEVVGAKDKTIRCWQGLRHEPLNESFEVRTQVVTELLTWIRERV